MSVKNIVLTLVAILGLVSCSGNVDTDALQDLFLEADKSAILNDGNDAVTFSVWYGNTEVTDSENLVIKYSLDGGEQTSLPTAQVPFKSTAEGIYEFTASYRTEGGQVVENVNKVVIKVVKVETYVRRALAMQFTSTGCPNCPSLGDIMADLNEPRVSIASFHTDYGGYSDPMKVTVTQTLAEKFGYTSSFTLPFFALDMNLTLTETVDKEKIETKIEDRLAKATTCGVAIGSAYEASTKSLKIDLKVTSSTERAYKYVLLLVEDGISALQMGPDDGASYIHNNVVRKMVNMYIDGDNLIKGGAFKPGIEVVESRTVTIEDDWNIENMRIIAAAMTPEDGSTYSCENVNECKAGSNVDYLIAE